MGENVAELFFGVDLGSERRSRRGDDDDYVEITDETQVKLKEMGIRVNKPYETEDRYIMIVESHVEVNDGGCFLGRELIPKQEWIDNLEKAAKMLGLVDREPGYFLVGHYD